MSTNVRTSKSDRKWLLLLTLAFIIGLFMSSCATSDKNVRFHEGRSKMPKNPKRGCPANAGYIGYGNR